MIKITSMILKVKEVPARNILKMLSEARSNARITVIGPACSIDVIMLNGKPIAAYGISKGRKTSGKEALEVVEGVEDSTAVAFKIDPSKIAADLRAEERHSGLPLRDLKMDELDRPALLVVRQGANTLILALKEEGQVRISVIGEKSRLEEFSPEDALVWSYLLKEPEILIPEEVERAKEVPAEEKVEVKEVEEGRVTILEEPIDYHSFVDEK